MSITKFAKKQFETIEKLTGGARPPRVLAGNDVLSGGKYSFKKFIHDAGEVSKAIPAPIKDEIKKQAIKVAMTALEDAPLALAAAGRKPKKAKEPKEVKPKKHESKKGKLVKGSKEAKEHMQYLRSLRKKK